jgi:hypothetical protein
MANSGVRSFFRDPNIINPNSATDYWVAWHSDVEKRKRVVWVHQLPDGRIVDSWLMADDYSQKWNSQDREWVNL